MPIHRSERVHMQECRALCRTNKYIIYVYIYCTHNGDKWWRMPIEIDLLIKNKRKIVQDRDSEWVDGTQYFFLFCFVLFISFLCTPALHKIRVFQNWFLCVRRWDLAICHTARFRKNFQFLNSGDVRVWWLLKVSTGCGCGEGDINVKIATLLSKQKSIWHCIGRLSSSKRFGLRLNEWMRACCESSFETYTVDSIDWNVYLASYFALNVLVFIFESGWIYCAEFSIIFGSIFVPPCRSHIHGGIWLSMSILHRVWLILSLFSRQ